MSERRTHELKTVQPFFNVLCTKAKTFEIRFNDRDFRVGDILILKEYYPETNYFTGRIVKAEVTYILHDEKFLQKGYVCMGLEFIPEELPF